jgi:hypothetical protein
MMSASLPPIRSRRSRVAPSTAGPARRDAPGDRRGAILRRMLEIQCGMPEIYSVQSILHKLLKSFNIFCCNEVWVTFLSALKKKRAFGPLATVQI